MNAPVLALDVFGGDYAPVNILKGALLAAKQGRTIALCGDEQRIREHLAQLNQGWEELPLHIVHAEQIITMDDEPVAAIKHKPRSSLVIACQLVAEGKAAGVISAGNSGAFMVAAIYILGREKDIERPAIAGLLPSHTGHVVGLDLGANTECRPHHLEQFAYLGNRYAQQILGIESPRIALLANGHEATKGSSLTKAVFPLLSQSKLNFVGNCEPEGIIQGRTDVVVCDGFSGNIMLKTMESATSFFAHQQKSKLITMHKSAVLLGIKGNVVVCHGNADEQAICQALDHALQRFHTENKITPAQKSDAACLI